MVSAVLLPGSESSLGQMISPHRAGLKLGGS